jgi:hypothetical protein
LKIHHRNHQGGATVKSVGARNAAACLAAAAAMALTGPAAAQAQPIKIGFVTELTGPWTFFGVSCVAGL